MKVIEIKNVVKIYNDSEVQVHAVNGIDLSFEEGEFAAIVGPSGSGKTTLLNMLGGLDNPTEGDILINGFSVSEMYNGIEKHRSRISPVLKTIFRITIIPAVIRGIVKLPDIVKRMKAERKLIDFRLNNIGFVFQSYNLLPVLTARENTELVMQMQGVSKEMREKRTKELLGAVGLGDRLDSRPSRLSGGQQQRVAVARALASKPRFILADEPTANLDSKTTENLLDIMEQLNKMEKITFIFSTHDARVVRKARRVITIEDGKVISDKKTA
ncbi:MAG: ABC transporter ATP-binding protein [Bacteroidales bacterium]|nr:ABC transporter ATP-binding protein [Bacteroidales bacterium]